MEKANAETSTMEDEGINKEAWMPSSAMEEAAVDRDGIDEDLELNPFCQLFSCYDEAKQLAVRLRNASDIHRLTLIGQMNMQRTELDDHLHMDISDQELIVNDVIQRILLITADKYFSKRGHKICNVVPQSVVLLPLSEELAEQNLFLINFDNLDQAIMERLTMESIQQHVVHFCPSNKVQRYKSSSTSSVVVSEPEAIIYLFQCHDRAYQLLSDINDDLDSKKAIKKCKTMIATFAGSCMLTPDILQGQNPQDQFGNLLSNRDYSGSSALFSFLNDVLECYPDHQDQTRMFYQSICSIVRKIFQSQELVYEELFSSLAIFYNICQHDSLLKLAIISGLWLPGGPTVSGLSFERTILGTSLCFSSIKPSVMMTHSFGMRRHLPSPDFPNPILMTLQQVENVTNSLRSQREIILEQVFKIFKSSLKTSTFCRNEVLHWIGSCLFHNRLRASSALELHSSDLASEPFFLNLSSILVELCAPFMNIASLKLLKIDPTICSVKPSKTEVRGIFMIELYKETKLAEQESSQDRKLPDSTHYNFITEIFFLTHKALHLAISPTASNYRNLMQHLAKLEQFIKSNVNIPMMDTFRQEFEASVSYQLSKKAHILDPKLLQPILDFYNTSAAWLLHIATNADNSKPISINDKLPLTKALINDSYYMLPEFMVDDMSQFIIFLGQFAPEILELQVMKLQPIALCLVGLMGSSKLVKNPHIRAQLAQAFAAFVPKKNASLLECIFAESIPLQQNLPECVVSVFVDMEKTDNSVDFEQKFGYRHNIYNILEYIWTVPAYKNKIVELGDEVIADEHGMKDTLFLRFIHLLINDAVFLLDEALTSMSDIKRLQEELAAEGQSDEAKQEKAKELHMASRMAQSLNTLGNQTVNALTFLTEGITRPFVEVGMADRIAAMLNYFAVQLVGPKMGNFKAKDFSRYNFKPDELICNIVSIYINLGKSERFCKAIFEDERSYTPKLFYQIERVLTKLFRLNILENFKALHDKVNKFAAEREEIEASMPEPPDEFLDPIMSTLMVDPVILPTSTMIVDRATIVRHLLSCQNDPFNRQPLHLDDIVPHQELKERIDQWLRENGMMQSSQNEDS